MTTHVVFCRGCQKPMGSRHTICSDMIYIYIVDNRQICSCSSSEVRATSWNSFDGRSRQIMARLQVVLALVATGCFLAAQQAFAAGPVAVEAVNQPFQCPGGSEERFVAHISGEGSHCSSSPF